MMGDGMEAPPVTPPSPTNPPAALPFGALAWALLRRRGGFIALGVCGALAVGLQALPGFDVLDYYFSLAIGIVGGVVGLQLGLTAARRGGLGAPGAVPPQRLAAAALLATALVLALPLAVVLLNALRVKNCNLLGGLAFYALGPLLGALYATVLGLGLGWLAPRAWLRRLLFGAALLALFGVPLAQLWLSPAIHLHHPFVGYVSGAIYDEVIQIGLPLLVYRLTNVLEAALIVLVAESCFDPARGRLALAPLRRVGLRRALVVGAGAAGVLAGLIAPAGLGYRHDRDAIRAALGGHVATAHFDLYFPAHGSLARHIATLAADCEFRREQLHTWLGSAPTARVAVYLYPDAAEKRRLMGADRTFIAKPWNREVHLHGIAAGDSVLMHELAHVFAADLAPPPAHLPTRALVWPHMGLVEGLAEAAEWDTGRYDPHEWSAAMLRLELAPDLRTLLGPAGFWATYARRAYTLMASFVAFLRETYGVAALRRAYADGDVEAATGVPLDRLVAAWQAFVQERGRSGLTPAALALAQATFGRQSVFQRVCALSVARLERQADEAALARRFAAAAVLRERALGDDPADPARALRLGQALFYAGESARAAALARDLGARPDLGPVQRARARWLGADLAWRAGRAAAAAAEYRLLAAEPLAEDEQRALQVFALATRHPHAEALRRYLTEPLPAAEADALLVGLVAAAPHDPLCAYLLGRRRAAEERLAEAARLLTTALTDDRALPPAAQLAALETLGRVSFLAEEFAQAGAVFRRAERLAQTGGERRRLATWAARCDWMDTPAARSALRSARKIHFL